MDGYMELFFHTGSPVFYTAAKREEDSARESAEQTAQWQKKS